MRHDIVTTNAFERPSELGPWSPGILVKPGGRFLFTHGIVARDPHGRVEGDMRQQARLALENLLSIFKEAGGGPEDVVKMTVFLRDIHSVDIFRDVRAEFWKTWIPCCTAVEVTGLIPDETLIEIEAVGIIGSDT